MECVSPGDVLYRVDCQSWLFTVYGGLSVRVIYCIECTVIPCDLLYMVDYVSPGDLLHRVNCVSPGDLLHRVNCVCTGDLLYRVDC